jgi:hypothetical protein
LDRQRGIPADDALAVDQKIKELSLEKWNSVLFYKGSSLQLESFGKLF